MRLGASCRMEAPVADVKVTLKLKNVNALMRSAPVQSEVNKRAAKIANAAGPKYHLIVSPHKWVARAFVAPVDGVQIEDADVAKLLGAIDAGRG